jgi:hypothetical protein
MVNLPYKFFREGKSMKRLAISLIPGFLLVLLLAGSTYAATVTIEPSAISVEPGKEVSIDIYINNVEDIYGASVDFIFDPGVVKVESGTDTPSSEQITNLTGDYFVTRSINQAQNTTGIFSYSKCLTGERPGVDINTRTLLCSLPLRVISNGTISVKAAVWNNKLSDLNLPGNTILIHLADSSAVPIQYSDPEVCYINFKSNSEEKSSSGGGRDGGLQPEVKSPSISIEGGKIAEGDVVVEIPPLSLNQEVKFKIQKIISSSALPLEKGCNLLSDVVEISPDKSVTFAQPITVTLKINSSAVDLENYKLGICWLDEESGHWIELDNITIDMERGIVSGEITHLTKFAVIGRLKIEAQPTILLAPELTDSTGHWAETAINELVEKGIIAGYPDGSFKPDNHISRAEFTSILVKAIGLNPGGKTGFADLEDHWARDYIAAATGQGIVSGYSSVRFGPEDNITREQMAVMIAKAARLPAPSGVKEFRDNNTISSWAREAVTQVSTNNLITGYPGQTFRPQNHTTRAEAASVINILMATDK